MKKQSENLPQHVAIIMDGNGRWAKTRHLPRSSGHAEGVKRVEEITQVASAMGIKALTLFTFSTENWTRPPNEVSTLMKTLCMVLNKKVDNLVKANIKFRFIGKEDGVPTEVLKCIHRAIEVTGRCTGMTLNMAFNYGSRLEILDAVRHIASESAAGKLTADQINEDLFSRYLYTHGLPDPDLLIRTSGEQRISNFLLWQLSYAELYFTEVFWPDFNEKEFKKAIAEYQNRERRYGNV